MRTRLSILAVLAVAISVVGISTDGVAVKQKLLLFGDSLTRETYATVTARFVGNPSYTISVHDQVGKAPCDFLPRIRKTLTSAHYALVALETAGNSQSACMHEPGQCARCYMPIGSREWEAKYRADLDSIVAVANSAGTSVLFISPPPIGGWSFYRNLLYSAVEPEVLADNPGLLVTGAPRASVSSPDGSFAARLPCLSTETATDGCVDGMIPVRAPDSLHFCPAGFASVCPKYSSGAFRFGTSEVSAILAAV